MLYHLPNYLTDSEDAEDIDLMRKHFPTPAYPTGHSVHGTFRGWESNHFRSESHLTQQEKPERSVNYNVTTKW